MNRRELLKRSLIGLLPLGGILAANTAKAQDTDLTTKYSIAEDLEPPKGTLFEKDQGKTRELFSLIESIIDEGRQVTHFVVEFRDDYHFVRYFEKGEGFTPSSYQMPNGKILLEILEAEMNMVGMLNENNPKGAYLANGLHIKKMPALAGGYDLHFTVTQHYVGIYNKKGYYRRHFAI